MVKRATLQHRLALFKHMLGYFGASDMDALRNTIKLEKETYDEAGSSYFFNALKGLNLSVVDEETLRQYDQNIKSYLVHINRLRNERIRLKYFQYLAVLFTEIFLDARFHRRAEFLNELNHFVEKENRENGRNYPGFSENDLSKLAFWMATGSGKTLIMHINRLQFRKYNDRKVDNVLLITPNEEMSRQHYEELQKSDIPARIFEETRLENDLIQVIDIHKLTEEENGKGVRVDISSFEGNNLVFVDEGHKGFSGKTWKSLRDRISEIGFTFEYSATFDEAIGTTNTGLIDEYSRAIIMDYSYSYFYYDGFGKEFTVLNLEKTEYDEHKELIFLTNLLSYYQQLRFYEENKHLLEDFSFQRPLWIFVGNSVSSGRVDKFHKDALSDVQSVVTFFNKFLLNRSTFVKTMDRMMKDRIVLRGKGDNIRFSRLLPFVKTKNPTAEKLYADVLKRVFHSQNGGRLELNDIDGSSGEVGLKVSGSSKYFALVYVGDTSSFKTELEKLPSLASSRDMFSESLFESINNEMSPINILIGSRKFMEGWNSFRVSTMGLLNMGRGRGAQIIQLFGRGVRLRGYDNLMKRTRTLIKERVLDMDDVTLDPSPLEVLNIFGIKADYVDAFKKQLEDKGISENEILSLKIKKGPDHLTVRPVTLKQKDSRGFFDVCVLEYIPTIPEIRIDLRPRIGMFESVGAEASTIQIEEKTLPVKRYVDYFDWDRIFFELYNFKQQRGFHNLYFEKECLIKLMKNGNYKVVVDTMFNTDTFKQFIFMEQQCLKILREYIRRFYNMHKQEWVTNNLEYGMLEDNDANFQDYEIILNKEQTREIEEITQLIKDANRIYEKDTEELPSIVFDKHLYQPLIIKSGEITTVPTGLNEGEEKFIRDLRGYFYNNRNRGDLKKLKFHVFRNLSQKGVGLFAETNNFYPDFILYVMSDKKQKIVFIDPKGLVHSPGEVLPKIEINNILKNLEKKLKWNDVNIKLTSFIIAGKDSSFDKIRGIGGMMTGEEFEKKHVVFQENDDYVDKIISSVMSGM